MVVKNNPDHRFSLTGEGPLESPNPTVQVSREATIVDQNSRFRILFGTLPGDHLDPPLIRFLDGGIHDHEKPPAARIPESGPLVYCVCPRVFQVGITRSEGDRWLVKLHPLTDACPAFNPILRQHGLTPREKEICCKVRQGLTNQEIASQLCISVHTAKTHLKNIYGKLNISNRPLLVSLLNRDAHHPLH